MAVYTNISQSEAQVLFINVGKITQFEGIQEGVENTNYKVTLEDNKKYILTIFEKRTKDEDLPFFNNAMLEFQKNGISCPTALELDGKNVFKVKNKNCSIYSFLKGRPTKIVNKDVSISLSELMSNMHIIGRESKLNRDNTMLMPSWSYILRKFHNFKEHNFGQELKLVSETIEKIQNQFPDNLNSSLIHADLFPDNIFFENNKISGVIDFFFTCNDTIIYDLSTLINSWFFIDKFSEENCKQFLNNYLNKINLSKNEKENFNLYLKASAIRFFLTRLHDMYFNNSGNVNHKDPMDFFHILRFHQKNNLEDFI
ncbi:homoserine kinase [Alphaproteobacteria bacterium]|nr:homoserine kinase [Alphaproteobacteria bacterium]